MGWFILIYRTFQISNSFAIVSLYFTQGINHDPVIYNTRRDCMPFNKSSKSDSRRHNIPGHLPTSVQSETLMLHSYTLGYLDASE
jgi:hypothetical protein